MNHAQLAFILGGAKLNLPFDIDLQDKDNKICFTKWPVLSLWLVKLVDNRKSNKFANL